MLNENFSYIVNKLGVPRDSVSLTSGQLAYAKAHLPSTFMAFLEEFGYGHYFKRGVQFCDALEFRPLMAFIFQANPDFSHADYHLISYNAFGVLTIWSERHWIVQVNLLQYQVWCLKLFPTQFNIPASILEEPKREVDANFVASGLLPSEENERELWDIDQEPMFNRCVKAHGALQAGECFGFVPSLGFTGYESKFRAVEYVQRVRALEHFSIIAQIKPFYLTRFNPEGYEYARVIGQPADRK